MARLVVTGGAEAASAPISCTIVVARTGHASRCSASSPTPFIASGRASRGDGCPSPGGLGGDPPLDSRPRGATWRARSTRWVRLRPGSRSGNSAGRTRARERGQVPAHQSGLAHSTPTWEPRDGYGTRLHHALSTDEGVRRSGARAVSRVHPGRRPTGPSSPCSSTRAGGDLLVRAWVRSFPGWPPRSRDCTPSNYGPYQRVQKFARARVTRRLRRPSKGSRRVQRAAGSAVHWISRTMWRRFGRIAARMW